MMMMMTTKLCRVLWRYFLHHSKSPMTVVMAMWAAAVRQLDTVMNIHQVIERKWMDAAPCACALAPLILFA